VYSSASEKPYIAYWRAAFGNYRSMDNSQQITQWLLAWNEGEESALNQLLPAVERELRRIAHSYMQRENPGHSLQTTALINEAYLKLINQHSVKWQNRAHFFALSAQIMRRILLNHARDKRREKRGGGVAHANIDDVHVLSAEKSDELIALDDALNRLDKFDKTKSRVVELRYFGGLTVRETAEVMNLAEITVMRHWKLAKAWLRQQLQP
jgi:RNA polymerase sigma factor (TIGR02999 family)